MNSFGILLLKFLSEGNYKTFQKSSNIIDRGLFRREMKLKGTLNDR